MASSSFALGFISQTKQDAFELDCGQFLVGGFSGCYWLKEAVVVAKGGEKRWKMGKKGRNGDRFSNERRCKLSKLCCKLSFGAIRCLEELTGLLFEYKCFHIYDINLE